jgi:hypothetical protein
MTMPPPSHLPSALASESFAAAVHRVAGVGADGRGALLNALAVVFATGTGETSRDAAVATLVETLNAGEEPHAMLDHVLPRVPLLHPYRHQKEPTWRWGSFRGRVALAEELWSVARATAGQTPRGAQHARAALLLAMQERFITGPATAMWLLAQPDFLNLTNWSPDVTVQITKLARAEHERTAAFSKAVFDAATQMQRVFTDSGGRINSPQYGAIVLALSAMARQTRHRPDVQWRLANFVWRLANLARTAGSTELSNQLRATTDGWKREISDPTFDRWAEEAFSEQADIKTPGMTIISPDELARRMRD